MKRKTKNILREMARHLGLKVVFVSYLTSGVQGILLPREKRILINAQKPRCEHVYTLLHEFGHFLVHFKKCAPHRLNRWYLNLDWKFEAMAAFASRLRRHLRFNCNKQSGKERDADLWALCAILYLQKHLEPSYLRDFLARHPEKAGLTILAASGILYTNIKQRTKTAFQMVLKPFSLILA